MVVRFKNCDLTLLPLLCRVHFGFWLEMAVILVSHQGYCEKGDSAMGMRVFTETVQSIEVTHKKAFRYEDILGRHQAHRAHLTIVATMESGTRVWLRVVENELDATLITDKIAIVAQYFQPLIGQKIRYCHERGMKMGVCEQVSVHPAFFISYGEMKVTVRQEAIVQARGYRTVTL
jgi:hypothetical protein